MRDVDNVSLHYMWFIFHNFSHNLRWIMGFP